MQTVSGQTVRTRMKVVVAVAGAVMAFAAYAGPAQAAGAASVSMSATPSPVVAGDQITYTINMANTSGAKVMGVYMTDQINGLSGLVLTSSVGTCSQSGNLVRCDAGTLQGFQSWLVTIRGTVTAAAGTVLHNTATLSSTKSSQTFNDSTFLDTLVVGGPVPGAEKPDLTLSTVAPTSVPGSTGITYTLTVNNQGGANANDVRVVDTLPAGVTGPVTLTTTSLFTCAVALPIVNCTGGRVNAGANATITISAIAPAVPGTITNSAVVDPENKIIETNEFNNASNWTTSVGPVPPAGGTLVITKTDAPDPVTPGDLLVYTITVTNTAATRADSIAIVDGTQGLDAASVSAVSSRGSCVVEAPKVICTQTSPTLRLEPGEIMTVTIIGTVVASAGSQIINTATVTGNIKNIGHTNTATATTQVKPKIDLTITKSDSPDPVNAADLLTYTFVVGNSGIYTATGVTVRDPLPTGMLPPKPPLAGAYTFAGTTGGFLCTVDASNVLLCTGGTILPESTETIVLHAVAPQQTGAILNTATIDPYNSIAESDETNNVSTQVTTVQTGIDLTVLKTADFDPVATSGTLTYTITVKNIGTQDTTGVVVRDTLPANTQFRTASADHNFTCSYSAGVVECISGIINGTYTAFPAVDTATITITIFAPPVPGLMTNIVRVDPDKAIPEINEDNNINSLTTSVGIGGLPINAFNELTIVKTQNFDPVAPNGVETYTLTIGNDATDTAFHVAVRDFLPVGARFIRADNGAAPGTDGGFQCIEAAGVVNCTGGTVQPTTGGSPAPAKIITIQAFAPGTPGGYPNRALVDPDNTIPEGNETNNTSTIITNVVLGSTNGSFNELSIPTISQSPANPVATNALVTYHLTVVNSGSDRAFNVSVRNFLPAGARYFAAVGSGGFFCLEGGSVINCVGGSIAGGGSESIDVTVFAPDIPRTYVYQARVDPDNTIPEADETNNTQTATTVVEVGQNGMFIDLTMTKTGPATVRPGQTFSYGLTVGNVGTDQAFNVKVRDILPAGLTFVSATGNSGFLCTQSIVGQVDCTGGSIAASGTANITVTVKAPLASGITITNQARVDPDNAIPEGDETNNTDSATTSVVSPIDLQITKTGPPSSSQNSEADYVIKVKNSCTASAGAECLARNVEVHDPLPVGLIILNVQTSDPKFQCQVLQNPVNVVDCLGDTLDKDEEVTITIHVFMTAAEATYTNRACVDPNDTIVESNELNNCSETVTVIATPDLTIKKTALSDPVNPGQNEIYTLHVTNIGTAGTTGGDVKIHDMLPAGLDFVSATGTNGFSCTFSSPTVDCTGDLAAGFATDITITTTVTSAATGPITNMAMVDAATGETNTGNNSSSVTVSLGATGIDLVAATMIDLPDPVNPGKVLTYTSTVQNTGSANATAVNIQQVLPGSGFDFVGAAGSEGFICTFVSPIVDCTGDLGAGHTTTITVQLLITAAAPAVLVSTLNVDPADTIVESDETNNVLFAVTTVAAAPCTSCTDLVAGTTLSSPASPATVAAGSNITYTFAVGNAGDTTATNVLIRDTLDPNVTFVSATASGTTCSLVALPSPHVDCGGLGFSLLPGAGTIVTIVVKVNGGTASGTTISNSATADPANSIAEFNEFNNTTTSSIDVT